MKLYSLTIYLLHVFAYSCARDVEPGSWKVRQSTDDMVDPTGWRSDLPTKRPAVESSTISCSEFLVTCQQDVDEYCANMLPSSGDGSGAHRKCEERPTCKIEMAFMKRFVNLLLKSAHLSSYRVAQGGPTSGLVDIRVTEDDLKVLERFADPSHEVPWHQLDTVMTRVIHSGLHMSKEYFTLMDNVLYFLSLREVWLGVAAFCMIMFVLWLLLSGHPFTGAFTIFFMTIFMFSYVMEFYRMFKEAEVKQMMILKQHSEIPLSCRPADMTWYQSLLNSFTSTYQFKSDECQKYYSAVMIDPMVQVSPSRVLSNIMADLVLSPASKVGEGIAFFTTGVLGNLPTIYGVPILLMSSIGIFIIVLVGVLVLSGSRIRLSTILFGVDIGGDTRQVQDSTRAATVADGSLHPMLEAFNKSSGSNLVIMDAASLKELITPTPSQNRTENSLEENMLRHRKLIDNIYSPEKNVGPLEETLKSDVHSQNVDHSADEMESKKKKNAIQQALDGSGDASSCL